MKFIKNIYGYDLYILNKGECLNNGIEFPSYALLDSACPHIDVSYAETYFCTLKECVDWAYKNRLE